MKMFLTFIKEYYTCVSIGTFLNSRQREELNGENIKVKRLFQSIKKLPDRQTDTKIVYFHIEKKKYSPEEVESYPAHSNLLKRGPRSTTNRIGAKLSAPTRRN